MPNLFKKIIRIRPSKKDVYIELTPENRICRIAVTDSKTTRQNALKNFMEESVQEALRRPFIPDNIILHYADIPSDKVPPTDVKDPSKVKRIQQFIIRHGIDDNSTISLRSAAFLTFVQEPITSNTLEKVTKRKVYKAFVEHENALEKISQGHTASVMLTVAKTDKGIIVFSDSLKGQKAQLDYLQYMADTFFEPQNEGLTHMQIYRFKENDPSAIQYADRCCRVDYQGNPFYDFTPSKGRTPIKLPAQSQAIEFDMRPTCANLGTFICNNAVQLSDRNSRIIVLDSILRNGFYDIVSVPAPYYKEFAPLATTMYKLQSEKDRKYSDSFQERFDDIQWQARAAAQQILRRDFVLRKDMRVHPIVQRMQATMSAKTRQNHQNFGESTKKSPRRSPQSFKPKRKV